MKKRIAMLMSLVMMVAGMSLLSGCGKEELTYNVDKEEFYFSTDNGSTYGNRKVEFEVGKSVYMQVVVDVTSSDEKPHDITGELKIPNIQAVDAYYLKGQKITPNEDSLNDYTVYPFTITTNEDWTFFFEFVPNSEGSIQMELTFDENVPEKYDMINTIKLVQPSEDANADDTKTEETTEN